MELSGQLQAVGALHTVCTERKVGSRFGRFGEEKNYHLYVGNRAMTLWAMVWDVRGSNPGRKKEIFLFSKKVQTASGFFNEGKPVEA
jgi:hypothetical protein